jgi:hypothetical protein
MKEAQQTVIGSVMRYAGVLAKQSTENREYLYFWILATLIDIAAAETTRPWAWAGIAGANLAVGLLAIGRIVRPIDQAFESIGLDYGVGYGKPRWIVDGKYPAAQDIIRVHAAGYSAADYEKHVNQLSARLSQPIKEIRKPSAVTPVVEVVLKRSHLPESLPYAELPLGDIHSGEFFVGKTDDSFEKLSLKGMIHMLVAGQTGSGKTQFLRQFMATILTQTHESFVALIDMKGGIDFQPFMDVPNFKLVTSYENAEILLGDVIALFEARKELLLYKKKTNWAEMNLKEVASEPSMKGRPIGPVVVVVDELAELAKKATERSVKSPLQEQLATLARLSRFTGIHLVLGTQRPDKGTLDMQSKDNLPTRVCFSVPSITASTLVIGDMSAYTLGNLPGRAIMQRTGNKVLQTPLIGNAELEKMLAQHAERISQRGYGRGLGQEVGMHSLSSGKKATL